MSLIFLKSMVWLFWDCPLFKFDCWFHLGYVCCCFQVGRITTDMMCCHCLTSEARTSVGPLLLMLTGHLVRVVYFQSMNMLCLSSSTFTVCLFSSQCWIVSDLWQWWLQHGTFSVSLSTCISWHCTAKETCPFYHLIRINMDSRICYKMESFKTFCWLFLSYVQHSQCDINSVS